MRLLYRFLPLVLLFLASCATHDPIVSNIDEREANEIIVFLYSKGIPAHKVIAPAPEGAAGNAPTNLFNIIVEGEKSTDAMALLNRQGLPRHRGTTLLQLFAKSGLMSSDQEETIRYQAGLAEQLQNTICKIDGILDADVQISFPANTEALLPGQTAPKITASVYIKHQGVFEDPNSHLETKIKRLVSASINGLAYEDVAVISDRSRMADIALSPEVQAIGMGNIQQSHVTLWSVVMTKGSVAHFRALFFTLVTVILILCGALGYLAYLFYPQILERIRSRGKPPEA